MKLTGGLELMIKPRGYGKSVHIIKESARTHYHIVTATKEQAGWIEIKARDMGIEIPTVYSVDDVIDKQVMKHERNILVDDLDCILSKALDRFFGSHVVCATMSEQEEESHIDKMDTNDML